jgi:AcrR family transcriptional regulator
MTPPDSSTSPRRIPQQKRGERRVAALITAAAAEFAQAGYEGATMSAIARRASAPIGSLYQFYPNKESLARALRTQYAKDYEELCAPLEAQARTISLEKLVSRFVALMVGFVQSHPAFLPLLEAPSTTRIPAARERHRQWIAQLLLAHSPRLPPAKAITIATVVSQINRGMMGLYAQSEPDDRQWIVEEFNTILSTYLTSRLRGCG